MEERFIINQIHICPVYKIGDIFRPDLEYPARYCVIDKEQGIAIDIKTKLKYDYVETMSHIYFISQSYEKIKGENRVAIIPYASVLYNGYDSLEASNIIKALKNNVEFEDGNKVYDNKSYLEYLKQEFIKDTENEKNKRKKFTKRKK